MAVAYPHESLIDSHRDGSTEPYIAEILSALLKAKGGHPVVLETGGFLGATSAWLALALEGMGGGQLWVAELEPGRVAAIQRRLESLPIENVEWGVLQGDVLRYIHDAKPGTFDFVFLDDDHSKLHVEQEVAALWSKMRPGGIMAFHDIDEPCDLQTVVRKYGGVALHYPKLGPSGGIGILQVPT